MENKSNQLIILGGGSSISEGLSFGLWDKLKGHFVIGTNYSYKFYEATLQTYVDSTFYTQNFEDIKKLPLIIGQGRHIDMKNRPENSFVISTNHIYNRDLKDGVYSAMLVGLYSLSLGIYLLDFGEIYLLGFDYGNIDNKVDDKKRKITHFYQSQINHRGIGKTSWYDAKNRADKDFGVYSSEKQCKIYNVSPLSKINIFEKISYEQFFMKLDNKTFDQNELRNYVKEQLKNKIK